MFEIKIDGADALSAKLTKYIAQVKELHTSMPEELVTWQRDDMKRKYPNIQVDSAGEEITATTEVWPRSRQPSKDRHHHRKQGPKQHRPARRGPIVHSTRPILRASLYDQLRDRMNKLLAEATKWP